MNTKFTCDANPIATEKHITTWIERELPQQWVTGWRVTFLAPVDCREGDEHCGQGPLHITGTVEVTTQVETHTYTLDSTGSSWRNYGHPSGSKYDVLIALRLKREKGQP